MTPEQKKKLKLLRATIDPDYFTGTAEEKFTKVQQTLDRIIEQNGTFVPREDFGIHKNEMARQYSYLSDLLGDMEKRLNGRMASHKQSLDSFSDDFLKFKKEHDAEHKKIDDIIGKHKKGFDQIIEQIRGEVSVSYSKMGGGTMPVLLQQEDALFVPDGVTTQYYFYNKPVHIIVGGATLVPGDGFVFQTTGTLPTTGYNIIFDNPPAAATSGSSAQTPHSFHY